MPHHTLPADFDDQWDMVRPAIMVKLDKKNMKVWENIWDSVAKEAFEAGVESVPNSISSDVLAKIYHKEHGLEFVGQMSDTDIALLKGHIKTNWGVGERKFARIVRDSYPCSDTRLKRIYRTEVHQADIHGSWGMAKKLKAKTKTRHAVGDERTCHICLDMDGETVPINEAYSDGSFVAHSHPGCRCVQTYKY